MAIAATAPRRLRQRPSLRPAPSPYNNRRWKAASRAFRSRPENVWCAECRKHNRLRRSTQTDHIIPHNGDEQLFWTEDQLAAAVRPLPCTKDTAAAVPGGLNLYGSALVHHPRSVRDFAPGFGCFFPCRFEIAS